MTNHFHPGEEVETLAGICRVDTQVFNPDRSIDCYVARNPNGFWLLLSPEGVPIDVTDARAAA